MPPESGPGNLKKDNTKRGRARRGKRTHKPNEGRREKDRRVPTSLCHEQRQGQGVTGGWYWTRGRKRYRNDQSTRRRGWAGARAHRHDGSQGFFALAIPLSRLNSLSLVSDKDQGRSQKRGEVLSSSTWSTWQPTWSKILLSLLVKKERKKTDNPREGWEDGTPPPHRDFKKRDVVR